MRRSGIQGSSFSEIQEPQALIVGPTRELVVQIYNEARKFSCNTMIRPAVLYGGVSVSYQLSKIDEGAHVLVGTPGRLLDIIKRKKVSTSLICCFLFSGCIIRNKFFVWASSACLCYIVKMAISY